MDTELNEADTTELRTKIAFACDDCLKLVRECVAKIGQHEKEINQLEIAKL